MKSKTKHTREIVEHNQTGTIEIKKKFTKFIVKIKHTKELNTINMERFK